MALPMIAAGIAARAVAKKLASRAAGGITGAGAKSVNPVYKNIGSNVKVVPSKTVPKTAPKTGLENRGAKPNQLDRINNARGVQWDKAEKAYDSDTKVAGYRGGPNVKPQGPKGKNLRQRNIIAKEASKKPPIKINSNPMRGK
jgi:hypothetical protein